MQTGRVLDALTAFRQVASRDNQFAQAYLQLAWLSLDEDVTLPLFCARLVAAVQAQFPDSRGIPADSLAPVVADGFVSLECPGSGLVTRVAPKLDRSSSPLRLVAARDPG